jgi:hypothetical protein
MIREMYLTELLAIVFGALRLRDNTPYDLRADRKAINYQLSTTI